MPFNGLPGIVAGIVMFGVIWLIVNLLTSKTLEPTAS